MASERIHTNYSGTCDGDIPERVAIKPTGAENGHKQYSVVSARTDEFVGYSTIDGVDGDSFSWTDTGEIKVDVKTGQTVHAGYRAGLDTSDPTKHVEVVHDEEGTTRIKSPGVWLETVTGPCKATLALDFQYLKV